MEFYRSVLYASLFMNDQIARAYSILLCTVNGIITNYLVHHRATRRQSSHRVFSPSFQDSSSYTFTCRRGSKIFSKTYEGSANKPIQENMEMLFANLTIDKMT